MGRTGRFYVSYVHWCCGDERHLDRLQVIPLRGGVVECDLGCFVACGSVSGPCVFEIGDSGAWVVRRGGELVNRIFLLIIEIYDRGPSLS